MKRNKLTLKNKIKNWWNSLFKKMQCPHTMRAYVVEWIQTNKIYNMAQNIAKGSRDSVQQSPLQNIHKVIRATMSTKFKWLVGCQIMHKMDHFCKMTDKFCSLYQYTTIYPVNDNPHHWKRDVAFVHLYLYIYIYTPNMDIFHTSGHFFNIRLFRFPMQIALCSDQQGASSMPSDDEVVRNFPKKKKKRSSEADKACKSISILMKWLIGLLQDNPSESQTPSTCQKRFNLWSCIWAWWCCYWSNRFVWIVSNKWECSGGC